MKELRDCYRGHDLFELYRFIVSECEDVNAYGVFLFLFDNEYEIRRFTQDEDAPEGRGIGCIPPGTILPPQKLGLMDVSDMLTHKKPANKDAAAGSEQLDRCPEDVLKYEIEGKE